MGLKLAGELKLWDGGLFEDAVYVSLHTADPTNANELSGNDYARVSVAAGSNGWDFNSGTGTASNSAEIQFPTPTGNWQDPTHFAIYTAATGGDMLWSGALSNNVNAPTIGQDVEFGAGALTFSVPTS